jgi:tRNA uridine 5-carboxymethylaminomethyl modification enzyme
LHIENGLCKGIVMKNGDIIKADKVILTTGTFLGGRIYIGSESREAGRFMRFKDNA